MLHSIELKLHIYFNCVYSMHGTDHVNLFFTLTNLNKCLEITIFFTCVCSRSKLRSLSFFTTFELPCWRVDDFQASWTCQYIIKEILNFGCSNRDLSMILDALLKTKSRVVLNDIINKNGNIYLLVMWRIFLCTYLKCVKLIGHFIGFPCNYTVASQVYKCYITLWSSTGRTSKKFQYCESFWRCLDYSYFRFLLYSFWLRDYI